MISGEVLKYLKDYVLSFTRIKDWPLGSQVCLTTPAVLTGEADGGAVGQMRAGIRLLAEVLSDR